MKKEKLEMEMRKKLLAMIESRQSIYQLEKDTMFPVQDEIKRIFYKCVSKSGKGGFLYLKTRNQLALAKNSDGELLKHKVTDEKSKIP